MVLDNFINTLILCGSFFLLMLCLHVVFKKGKKESDYLLGLFLLLSAILLFSAYFHLSDLYLVFLYFNETYVPPMAAYGPTLFLYIKSEYGKRSLRKSDLWHYAPFVICLVLLLPFFAQGTHYKENHDYWAYPASGFIEISSYAAAVIADLTSVVYLIIVSITAKTIPMPAQGRWKGRTLLNRPAFLLPLLAFHACVWIRVVGTFTFSSGGGLFLSTQLPALILMGIACLVFILNSRNQAYAGAPGKKSDLKHANVLFDEDYQSIYDLVKRRQYYLDPNITVVKLAKLLKIQPHRLSGVINAQSQNGNFQCFINAFRIEYAKTVLHRDEKQSIIDVAYECGFNSKSAFYRQFARLTNETPDSYRKRKFEKAGCSVFY